MPRRSSTSQYSGNVCWTYESSWALSKDIFCARMKSDLTVRCTCRLSSGQPRQGRVWPCGPRR